MLAQIKPQSARTSALVGAVVWAIVLFIRTAPSYETELIDKILLFAVLIVVPLALSLVATPDGNGKHGLLYRLAVITQPFGAAAVITSFLLDQGIRAALLASAWLMVTSLIALYGLWRLSLIKLPAAAEVSIDVGLIYLSVGSGWLVMSRLGIQPLGFGDTIVLLTAAHFHYAGFAAPILTGLAGRKLSDAPSTTRRLFVIAAIAITIGTPLVATGITVSPVLALVGTLCNVIRRGVLDSTSRPSCTRSLERGRSISASNSAFSKSWLERPTTTGRVNDARIQRMDRISTFKSGGQNA